MTGLRALRVTLAFIAVGTIAGAIISLLSLTPIWLGLTQLPRNFIGGWGLSIIATVGAICGSVVMPALGWLVIGRIGFWRSILALTTGAVLGENLIVPVLRSMESDVLIIGAFLGAVITVLLIRLTVPPRRPRTEEHQ